MRGELAHGDIIIATARPILRHLLANDDHALFSDEVIARIRGMMLSLSREMLLALARKVQAEEFGRFIEERVEVLAVSLLEDPDFLGHAHALTIEAQIAERLQQRSGIDPVLSPLFQELAASNDEAIAGSAMRALSAQARFMQQQRRMELPLNELPEQLFKAALTRFLEYAGDHAARAEQAAATLREQYDPEQRRVGQIIQLISAMQHRAPRALEVDNSGVSVFATALSMASDQKRDIVILSLGENQCARLALSLRAAGLGQKAVEEQFLYLHPDITLPEGFETLRSDRAAAMLAAAQTEIAH